MRALALLCVLLAAPALADEAAMARAKKIVAGSCFLCHGMQGESATELFPRLAAQNAAYVAKQLQNFKTGERKSEAMPRMVTTLTEEDMRALGLYFSRQPSPPHPPADPKLAAQGEVIYRQGGAATEVAACTGCHGERGYGSEQLPRLAGQVPGYLVSQLRNFGKRARTNDNEVMHTVAARMTEAEILAVAEYLAGLD